VTRLTTTGALLTVLFLFVQNAAAHTRSESYSHWHVSENRITATVTVPLREVMILYEGNDASVPARELFQQHLVESTSVSGAGQSCARTDSNVLQAASGFVRVELQFDCANALPDTIQYRAMFDRAPAHVHYAKLHSEGLLVGEALLTDSADTWDFGDIASGDSWSFVSFVGIGTEHIASGFDHVAFLLGLLLIARSAGRAIIAITGFTLGHSISLAAAVLGYVHADSQLVEAFIGFTVLLVAGEYFLLQHSNITRFALASTVLAWATGVAALALGFIDVRALFAYLGFGIFAGCYLLASRKLQQHERRRATLLLFVATCSFGLVHGFGFAGFLMETGLLGTSLLVPLLGFNLGVELGQLILVTVALFAGVLLRNHVPRIVPQLVAAGLCGIGVFWFVGRTLA
jgi:hypothetical protein